MKRYIQIVSSNGIIAETAGHAELLAKAGYECRTIQDVIEITCSDVVEGTVDFSSEEKVKETMVGLIAARKVFSYKTKFILPDGKTYQSLPGKGSGALNKLGWISAFITKGLEAPKAKKQDMSSMFASLQSVLLK